MARSSSVRATTAILVNVYRDKEQVWHGHGYDDLEDALIAVNEEVRTHLSEDGDA